jgi:hypothetical protein
MIFFITLPFIPLQIPIAIIPSPLGTARIERGPWIPPVTEDKLEMSRGHLCNVGDLRTRATGEDKRVINTFALVKIFERLCHYSTRGRSSGIWRRGLRCRRLGRWRLRRRRLRRRRLGRRRFRSRRFRSRRFRSRRLGRRRLGRRRLRGWWGWF